jgi:hypothetical protein
LFWQVHDILDFLDPKCHVLWTHLESRLEVFRKTKALVILVPSLIVLIHVLEFLFKRFYFSIKQISYRPIFSAAVRRIGLENFLQMLLSKNTGLQLSLLKSYKHFAQGSFKIPIIDTVYGAHYF